MHIIENELWSWNYYYIFCMSKRDQYLSPFKESPLVQEWWNHSLHLSQEIILPYSNCLQVQNTSSSSTLLVLFLMILFLHGNLNASSAHLKDKLSSEASYAFH